MRAPLKANLILPRRPTRGLRCSRRPYLLADSRCLYHHHDGDGLKRPGSFETLRTDACAFAAYRGVARERAAGARAHRVRGRAASCCYGSAKKLWYPPLLPPTILPWTNTSCSFFLPGKGHKSSPSLPLSQRKASQATCRPALRWQCVRRGVRPCPWHGSP